MARLVAAALIGANASEFFTQDGDMPGFGIDADGSSALAMVMLSKVSSPNTPSRRRTVLLRNANPESAATPARWNETRSIRGVRDSITSLKHADALESRRPAKHRCTSREALNWNRRVAAFFDTARQQHR